MTEQTPQRSQHPPGDDDCSKPTSYGDGGRKPDGSYEPKPEPKPCPEPKPEPKPCPDPCDTCPPWGPPKIPTSCCPDRDCCPEPKDDDAKPTCTWDEVDDPCVRASACVGKWTKITCTCESSNTDCTCEHWECGSYPQGTCVPCDPCQGLPTPPETPPNGGPTEPPGGDGKCGADELRRRLGQARADVRKAQEDKAEADRKLKTGQDSEKELTALIDGLEALVKAYKESLYKLKCREDCLKGFARDTAQLFESGKRFPKACLDKLRTAINDELCKVEKAKCCVKNIESKLSTLTRLGWQKQEAERALKKAEDAFKAIKDLPKWIGDQFSELEAVRDQIVAALGDKDPQKQNVAFYLFYWKFVPGLCRRFPVPLCCEPKEGETPARTGGTPVPPPPAFGCTPGDWHPSHVPPERLRELVCCALDVVNTHKDELQTINKALETLNDDLKRVKAEIPEPKALEERIKTVAEKFKCEPVATGA